MNIIIAIVVFSVLIVIHELGHFLLAKSNGIYVTEFSIGMGPRILSMVKTPKGYRLRGLLSPGDFAAANRELEATIYSIKILPIGGSCMMLGEDDTVEDERAFNKKGVWARISVILAGPIFNFILAFILALIIVGMQGYDPAKIASVKTPAVEAGLQEGDVITKINGKNINFARELGIYLYYYPFNESSVDITYKRGEKDYKTTLNPQLNKYYKIGYYYSNNEKPVVTKLEKNSPLEKEGLKKGDIITKVNDVYIETTTELREYFSRNPLSSSPITLNYLRNGVENKIIVSPVLDGYYSIGFLADGSSKKEVKGGDIFKYSLLEVKYSITSTIESLGMLIKGTVSPDELAGPVGIVDMIGDIVQNTKDSGFTAVFLSIISFSILLSANLGVMNLLPIPALDGGRLIFLLLEVFRGKPIDQTKEGIVHMIGFIALMILMIFVVYNDISRIF